MHFWKHPGGSDSNFIKNIACVLYVVVLYSLSGLSILYSLVSVLQVGEAGVPQGSRLQGFGGTGALLFSKVPDSSTAL